MNQQDANALLALLPHGPAMRLIAQVLAVDASSIRCRITSHRDLHNPMRREGAQGLGAACGVEMAAQAIAMHAAHLALEASGGTPPNQPRGGMLTSVRDLQLTCDRLDTIASDLLVLATFTTGDANAALYSFALWDEAQGSEQQALLTGRVSVVGFVS
jgi:predicted hotdog family 3-hydroxylacyl-ACP dehydratase